MTSPVSTDAATQIVVAFDDNRLASTLSNRASWG